ncbi:MAG TPA: secretin N-terminal domain-containing protein [Steroidobacteraceae bacterium]|jgi:general secretion pathway protein D|nr:secretin N-terminal domain-containing protein [Steroidobacteraceae bacterium]
MKPLAIIGLIALSASPGLAVSQESSLPSAGSKEPPTISVFDLIARVHRKTGQQFIVDPHASGFVVLSGLDVDRIDYDMLMTILRQQGLVAVAGKGAVRIMPDAEARQQPAPTLTADDAKVRDEDLVTRVVQVRNACAAHMVPVLRPLMPQYAHMAAYPPTNTVILLDRADNVRRVADLIERLDKTAPGKLDCGAGKGGS